MKNRNQICSLADASGRRSGTFLMLPSRLLASLLVMAVLTPCHLPAQSKTAKPAPSSDRCLLIVETSRSTRPCAEAVLKVVQEMLMSGLNGQLRLGDTLGVWTFNDELYSGRFPLQTWSPQDRKEIAERTVTFLKAQKYEMEPSWNKVLPVLNRVIEGSQLLTVIVVSSGDERIRGTPFDDRINEFYQQWHDQQKEARMPFVTVLRVKNGQLADYVVNTPPWPLQMPRPSAEAQSAKSLPAKVLAAPKVASSPAVAPLIVSGKKPELDKAPKPKPEPVVAKADAPAPAAVAATTNEPVAVKPPEPAVPPAAVAKIEPVTESPPKPLPAPLPAPEPKAVEAAPSKPEPVAPPPAPQSVTAKLPEPAVPPATAAKIEPAPAVSDKPATEVPPKPLSAPVPAPEPKAEVVTAPAAKPVEPAPPKPEPAPAPTVPKPTPVPVVVEQTKPSPAPEAKAAPAPAPAATSARLPETPTNAAVAVSAPPRATSPVPPPAAPAVPPAQVATAVPDGPLASHRTIWLAGLALAVVAGGLTFLLLRRSRAAPQASLITRSFERKNKP